MKSFWNKVGYVKSSKYRLKILKSLFKEKKTPKEIAEGLNFYIGHVSRALGELSDKDLVKCLNPEQKKGRIYSLTKDGEKVIGEIG